jgi:hypothetical protein
VALPSSDSFTSNVPFFRRPTFWIFFLCFFVRLFAAGRLAESAHFIPDGDDTKYYSDWALRIVSGKWTDGQAFYGLPGYPFLLAALYGLMGFNPYAVAVVQAFVESATSVVICHLGIVSFSTARGKDCKNDDRMALGVGCLAAVGWIVFLPAQAFSIILMPTCWLVLAFWGCVLWILTLKSASIWRPWFPLGLVLGFVAMLVATILFLVPLAIAAIGLHLFLRSDAPWIARAGRCAAAIVILISGVVLGASPAAFHNYFIAGEPVFLSAHSGINLWIGNSPVANGYPKIPDGMRASQDGLLRDSITFAEREAGSKLTRAEVSAHWSAKAKQWMRENPEAWRKLMARKLVNVWNAYQYDDLSIISMLREQGVLHAGLRFGVVAALGIPGLILVLVCGRRGRWIAAAVLLHLAALLPVFVTERYRLCAVPGLLLCGAWGLFVLRRWLLEKRWLPAGSYLAGLGCAVWFVTVPRGDETIWSLDAFNTAVRALQTENFPLAERKLAIAHAYTPESAEIHFALGNLWLAKGDRDRAKNSYRLALRLDPQHSDAWNNLGVLALEEDRYALAAQFLENAVRFEPQDAKSHYVLARAYLKMGRHTEAQQAIEQALKLRPAQQEFIELQKEMIEVGTATEETRD